MGYQLSEDPHIRAAQLLGMQVARDDGFAQCQEDAAQCAVQAYLEQKARGTAKVTKAHILGRLIGCGEWPGRSRRARPLLRDVYPESFEALPSWAE